MKVQNFLDDCQYSCFYWYLLEFYCFQITNDHLITFQGRRCINYYHVKNVY